MAFEWLNFKPIADTVSGAFGWLKNNPEVAAGLAGAAGAGIGYLKNREQIEARKEEVASERAYREQFGGASSLGAGEYGQGLNITQPRSGIATGTDTGTIGPMEVGTVGQQPTMASAFELRAQRQGGRYGS